MQYFNGLVDLVLNGWHIHKYDDRILGSAMTLGTLIPTGYGNMTVRVVFVIIASLWFIIDGKCGKYGRPILHDFHMINQWTIFKILILHIYFRSIALLQ